MSAPDRFNFDDGAQIAVISDVHGNLPALEAVLTDAANYRCDLTVNLGDIVSGPLWPAETAELLMSLSLPTISGNHERQLLADDTAAMGAADRFAREALSEAALAWIASFPSSLSFGEEVRLVHGSPASDLDYLLETVDEDGRRVASQAEVEARLAGDERRRLVLCGHSHVPRQLRVSHGCLVANPGSVGLQAFRWDRPHPHIVGNRDRDASYAIVERQDGLWSARHIRVAYDFEAAARKAETEGDRETAYALRTGSPFNDCSA